MQPTTSGDQVIGTHLSYPGQQLIDGTEWNRTKGAILPFSDATCAPTTCMIHKREKRERKKMGRAYRMGSKVFGQIHDTEPRRNIDERIGLTKAISPSMEAGRNSHGAYGEPAIGKMNGGGENGQVKSAIKPRTHPTGDAVSP